MSIDRSGCANKHIQYTYKTLKKHANNDDAQSDPKMHVDISNIWIDTGSATSNNDPHVPHDRDVTYRAHANSQG